MSNYKRVDAGVFRIIIGGKGQRIINEIFPFARSGQNAHEITPGWPMKLQKWFKSYLNILFCIELFTLFNSDAWRYASHLPVTVTNTVNLDEIGLNFCMKPQLIQFFERNGEFIKVFYVYV